jgi:hypothetical protein
MTSTPSVSRAERSDLRLLGDASVASGLLGFALGLLTLVYTPAVAESQWSYPFSTTVQLWVGLALAVTHALTLAGFVGVLRADPYRGSRLAAGGLWVSVVGFGILSIAEIWSGLIGDELVESSVGDQVGSLFGVGSLATAIGSIVAGVVIVRSDVWDGLGRWALLASGTVMLLVVTPAVIGGGLVARTSALMLWSLLFIPIGRAVRASSGPRP